MTVEDPFLHHKVCFEAKTQNLCLDFLYTHVLVCSEQLWLELQQTKDIEIVHQMQKKSNLTRLGFYVVWENVLNTPKLSIFACPDWIELDASRSGKAFIKQNLQETGLKITYQ